MNTLSARYLLAVSICIAAFITGCAPAVSNPASIDEFNKLRPVQSEEEYRIQPGDQLEVKFFYNPELNEQLTVRPDGRISMQLANEINVAGMTASELVELLKERYSTELESPEISVLVRSFNDQKVYVDGEVAKPGLISLGPAMTVLQSISQAGGVKDTGRMSEVIVIRRAEDDPSVTKSVMLDLDKALDGTDKLQDVELRPYDIVYVPRKHVSNLNNFVDQYIRKNLPVSVPFGLF